MKILLLWLGIIAIAQAQQPSVNEDHTKWVAESLKSMQTIKPGMTRADLLKIFRTEGGLSTRLQHTYVFRECPYIKVDVEFEAEGDPENLLDERSEDKIVKISAPYLQWSIMD